MAEDNPQRTLLWDTSTSQGSNITNDGDLRVYMPYGSVSLTAGASIQITDGTETWSIDTSGYGQIDIAAQSLTAVKISKDANANSLINPIYVQTVNTTAGSGSLSYDYVASLAGGDTSTNLDFTVPAGKTWVLKDIIFSGSDTGKAEVVYDPSGTPETLSTIRVSPASPTFDADLKNFEAAAGNVIRVTVTNTSSGSTPDEYNVSIGREEI